MAKKHTMGKVKRYNHSFYSGRMFLAKKAAKWVLVVAVLFAVGFLAAPAVINWGTHTWYTQIKGVDLAASSAASSEAAASSAAASPAPTAEPEPTPPPAQTVGTGAWSLLSLSSLGDQAAIDQTAADLSAQGVSYGIVTLKDSSGYIYYPSTVANASRSIAATTVDAAATAASLKAKGIVPVAYICAFQDPLSGYADRTMAIHYSGSDYLWLDAAADAGGKPWLNPYSDTAVQFIGDLIEEAYGMGYEQVVLSTAQFPASASAKQDFGDTQGRERAAQLTQDIAAWKARFDGRVVLWYEVSYNNCLTPGAELGETAPNALGVENLVIQMPASAEPTATPVPTETPAESGTAGAAGEQAYTLEDVVQMMKDGGCANVVVRSGNSAALS